ncbi:MAG: starch-binding protein [Oscillospiraceae bacterium]|nr:starch-binding protein [Oscillospiraceae bacterium]MCL2278678.1 starch-binding protein [Oscillospiraceae bacterium]
MKKIIATFLTLLLLLSVSAFAPILALASPDDMVVIYVSVPNDWENPCIWAWDDGGNSVFSAWPGGEMDPDPGNPGWYYIHLPNWANNIIVNANNGEVQTDALQTEGNDAWVIVSSPDDVQVTFEQQTVGEAPEFVERITVHARIPADWDAPSLWAWLDPDGTNAFDAWPGGAMRLIGDWYSTRAPSWINSIIVNANEGTVQTDDFTGLTAGNDLWIVVDDDLTAEIFYENPDLIVPGITIRVIVPADWENPNLWAWSHPDGTNAFASWPGEPLERDGDWYVVSAPGWVNSLIVNANDGSIQTGDMSEVEVGADIWIVVHDEMNYEYFYSEPDVDFAIEEPPPPPEETPEPTPEPPPPIAQPETEPEPDGNNTVLWIVLGVVGAVIVAIIVVALVKKKKK